MNLRHVERLCMSCTVANRMQLLSPRSRAFSDDIGNGRRSPSPVRASGEDHDARAL